MSPNLGFKRRNGLRREVHVTLGYALLAREVQGVAQPVLIVALFEVFASMRTTGLFASLGCDSGRFGNFEQVLQFQRLDTGGDEGLTLVRDLDLGDTLAEIGQLGDTFLHVFAGTEYTEVVLHALLQLALERSHVFTSAALVDASQTRQGLFDVGFAGTTDFHAFFQRFFQVQTSGAAEHNQVEQRVAAQTVGTVYRYAGHFTDSEQTFDDLVVAVGVLGDGLTVDVGGNTAHHVVAGRDNRDRCDDRVDMCEGLRQFADARQTAVQHFLAQVVELEQYVILVRANTVTGDNLFDHRAGNHVATSQVFGIGRVTLHEALAMGVDQVTTLTAAAFGNQYTSAGNTGQVELPHFDVLHRHAGTQGHAHAVTGIDQGVGGGGIDTAGTTSGQNHGLGADVDRFAGFDADGDDANDGTVLVLHQI